MNRMNFLRRSLVLTACIALAACDFTGHKTTDFVFSNSSNSADTGNSSNSASALPLESANGAAPIVTDDKNITGTSAIPTADELRDAKQVVNNIYSGRRNHFNFRQVKYTPDLEALIDEDDKEANGEAGLLDFDPFCGCQDTPEGGSFTSSVRSTGPGKATVTVTLHWPPTWGGTQIFRIDLLMIGRDWYVADLHGPKTPSLVGYLRKWLKHPPRAATAASRR